MANQIMDDLMASLNKQPLSLTRGQQVTGTVVLITNEDVILDLGTKAEGVIPKRELPSDQLEGLKVGQQLKAFVISPEGPSGQVSLSMMADTGLRGDKKGFSSVSRFISYLNNKQSLKGRVTELNRGGLVIEVDGTRGFLPSSQVKLGKASGLEELVGHDMEVLVSEVDPENSRLILTQKVRLPEAEATALAKIKEGDSVEAVVKAVLPSGLILSVKGPVLSEVEGYVHISDIAWERVEDLASRYNPGQQVEAKVISVDDQLGRLNLSIKGLAADPFIDYAQSHQVDDVVSGTVVRVTDNGVVFKLAEGVEGLMHSSKKETSVDYKVGQTLQLLIDNIDAGRHRISLAPFLTSTAGLIYK